MTADRALVEARGLVRSFGQTPALRGASVSVAAGEILAIMGPSGSGKSTLLHCLAGILTPDEGAVWFAGRRVDTMGEGERSALRRERFGFVFQFGQLVPELTAEENVALPLLLDGTRRAAALTEARAWFGRLGLEGRERHRSGELSGGEARRVAWPAGWLPAPGCCSRRADRVAGLDDRRARAVRPVTWSAGHEVLFAVIIRRVRWRIGLVLLLAAGGLCGCGSPAARGPGSRVPAGATCDTAVASAPALRAVSAVAMAVPGNPFGVAVTADGRWSFVTLNSAVEVLSSRAGAPAVSARLGVPGVPQGEQLAHDGRYLLVADDSGALVIDVARAESGARNAVVGMLSSPAGRGAAEVAVSPDDRFAFVTLEISNSLAVFDLQQALARGFGPSDFVGTVPLGIAPVGLAVSPDGRWIYATSQASQGGAGTGPRSGTLTAIDLRRAETRPSGAVVAAVGAGCSPVRVITSADGGVVWVTARGSDAVLGFSAARLRTDPGHARVAQVQVGEAPVALALVGHGRRLVVADSNRFSVKGAAANLAVVDVAAAMAGRPALLGTIATGTFPREMAVLPDANTLLVTDYLSEQIQAVNLQSLP